MVNVIGEALIDLVAEPVEPIAGTPVASQGQLPAPASASAAVPRAYRAHPGGSPYNVAIGLARLGQRAVLQARLSHDAFGRQLRAHAEANAVDLSATIPAAEPTTLAIVGLDERRNATYDFYLNGTADWQWTAEELARGGAAGADAPGWVHTGSLASWTGPGADVIEAHLLRLRRDTGTVISYDPNVRPMLMPDHDAAVAAIERSVGLAHVVKASAEDLHWLYAGRRIADVALAWQALGPALVVVTDGAAGAHAVTSAGQVWSVPGRQVDVVDTVGAGDAFMAGLINALVRTGLVPDRLTADAVRPVLDEAVLVAALTCARAGANPPTAAELGAAQATG